MRKFTKLDTDSDFPLIENIDVYKYDNEFDYSRYDYTQMDLQICAVPWDMGEAHVGNRTISGIGNVVYFDSKENRDAWFDAIPDDECYRFSTKFKELHRDLLIDVPLPYDVCAKFNYLKVHYSLFANDDSPVQYENENGLRDWFWFIREVEFIAPNTTRLHLLDDAFQTWIYDVNITGMVLERGHAPMFAMRADEYLSNPIENNEYLLTEDVNFGQICQVKHMDVLTLNAGNMYACIATSANPLASWGSKANDNWHTPASSSYTVNGQPSVYVFALPVDSLSLFLSNVNAQIPQFKQTIQGVFFASADLLSIGQAFTFANTECFAVSSSRVNFNLSNLSKTQFAYPQRYADLAKLYTSPYAHIEITDESGNVDIVHVEDTTGTLDVSAALSLAYPFITIDAHVLGAGGNAQATITYRNVTAHTFDIAGQWYETIRSWNVPIFAVVLDAATEYDYSTHFDRLQRVIDYTTSYDNAAANASTAKANADASAEAARVNVSTIASANKANTDDSADTAKGNVDLITLVNRANADDSATTAKDNVHTIADANKANADKNADTIIDNADLTKAANLSTKNRSNLSAETDRDNTTTFNNGMAAADNVLIGFNATSTIAANDQQGSIAAASSVASSTVGAIGTAVSGDVLGAVTGVAQGVIGGVTTLASTAVANGLTSSQATYAVAGNNAHASLSNTKSTADTTNRTDTATDLNSYQDTLIDGTSANSAGAIKANATRTQTAEENCADLTEITAYGNAQRTFEGERAAADATRTTTKANATRTQTAENTAAVLTETTTKANALRTYDTAIANASRNRTQAQNAISNGIAQAALREPFIYGQFANGEGSANKPIALFANIVTQSKAAISSAGDEFLRYGYTLDKFWQFDGNWNIGKYFTYWKLRDFWVTNLNVPDMYMDKLRFFLFGGVTIWRHPQDIGRRTIYENFN